uniref:C2H2-type domain-containing protein n=1 Tax=Arion vulgaris TaxID=1028688 RepID=A0A0B6Z633_9EUPU
MCLQTVFLAICLVVCSEIFESYITHMYTHMYTHTHKDCHERISEVKFTKIVDILNLFNHDPAQN